MNIQQHMNQLNKVAKQLTKNISSESPDVQRNKLVSKSGSGNSDRVSSNSSSLSSTSWGISDNSDSTSSSIHESHLQINNNHGQIHEQNNANQQANPIVPNGVKKTLAFIEAQDNNEMLMVINMLKNQFPNINLHLCSTDESVRTEPEMKREIDELSTKRYLNVHGQSNSLQSSDLFLKKNAGSPKSDSYQYYRNSLSASSCYHGNSVSSIDNSPQSSNNTSFERQESRDSENCYVNKNSFDSTKGFPLAEMSTANNQLKTNPGQFTLQKQQQQAFANTSHYSHSSHHVQPVHFDFEHKFNLNSSPSLSASHNPAIESNESRKFLTSPTNFNRSPIHNWKKWKKGQAWRYNSSSNLSENSATNINENSNHSLNANSNNSSFSYEKTEDEFLNESNTNNNFLSSQINNNKTFGFSNSFEYETSNAKAHSNKANTLSQWSSTSQIEKNSLGEELKGKKRRGKLMRDQTIDNSDEQSTSINCLNPSCLNPACMKESSLNSNQFLSHNENSQSLKSEGSPKSLSRCTSPAVLNASTNGRVSPPEKRVTLGSNTDLNSESNNDNSNDNNNSHSDEEIQNIVQKSLSSFYNDKQINQLDLSILVANVLKNKSLFNNELMQQIMTEQLRQKHSALLNHHQSSSPSSCAGSPQRSVNNAALLNTVKQLSHLSLRQDSMDSIKNSLSQTLANQFEYYQDMVKLGIENSGAQNGENKQLNFADMNQEILSENRLNPNGKYYMMKNHQVSASFESSNSNKSCSNSQMKPIYRSNSSPSYSSMHSTLKNSQQQVPLSLYNMEHQKKSASGKDCSIESNNPNNSIADKPLSGSGSGILKNSVNENDIFPKKNGSNDNGYLKPVVSNSQVPEIVITESKMDSYSSDYTADVSRKSEIFKTKEEKQDYFTNNGFSLNNNLLLLSNNSLFRSNSTDLGKPKFSDLPWANQTISFEEILKANQENSPKNWKLNINRSQTTSVKSLKLLKPHVCSSCQKRFARSDMLIRHSRLHSGIRPYRCNRCGQEFSRSDHLNTHLRTHTGEKPYSCPHPKCSYAACRKDMITRHLKVHNKNKMTLSGLSFDSNGTTNESSEQPVFSNAKMISSNVSIQL